MAVGYSSSSAPHQGQTAGRLREPLIPADADADAAKAGIPHLEAGVAGGKVEFFLIVVVVRDVGLAVDAQQGAICVQHCDAVEQLGARLLIEADGQHYAQLLCHRPEVLHCRILCRGGGVGVIFILPFLTEIGPLEQFRQQDDLGPFAAASRTMASALAMLASTSLAHCICTTATVTFLILLSSSYRFCQPLGICWVTQWMLPPPTRMLRAGMGYTLRPGNSPPRMRTASASFSSPNCGRMMPPLEI